MLSLLVRLDRLNALSGNLGDWQVQQNRSRSSGWNEIVGLIGLGSRFRLI